MRMNPEIVYGYSSESPRYCDSNEYPQHVLWRTEENYLLIIIKYPPNICCGFTIKFLKIWTPEKFTVITLKFEQSGFTIEKCVKTMQTSVNPDQTTPLAVQSGSTLFA